MNTVKIYTDGDKNINLPFKRCSFDLKEQFNDLSDIQHLESVEFDKQYPIEKIKREADGTVAYDSIDYFRERKKEFGRLRDRQNFEVLNLVLDKRKAPPELQGEWTPEMIKWQDVEEMRLAVASFRERIGD